MAILQRTLATKRMSWRSDDLEGQHHCLFLETFGFGYRVPCDDRLRALAVSESWCTGHIRFMATATNSQCVWKYMWDELVCECAEAQKSDEP